MGEVCIQPVISIYITRPQPKPAQSALVTYRSRGLTRPLPLVGWWARLRAGRSGWRTALGACLTWLLPMGVWEHEVLSRPCLLRPVGQICATLGVWSRDLLLMSFFFIVIFMRRLGLLCVPWSSLVASISVTCIKTAVCLRSRFTQAPY